MVTSALIVISGCLFYAALYCKKHKHYKLALTFAYIWITPLAIRVAMVQNETLEQWVLWITGFASLGLAHSFLKKNDVGYAFVTFLVSAFLIFCGSTGMQALLRNQILWQVTASLKSYGEKLDKFNDTVTDIRGQMSAQNESNRIYQVQIAKSQKEITSAKKQISDIETLIEQVASRNEDELLEGNDANHVMVISHSLTNPPWHILRLKRAAIPRTFVISVHHRKGLIDAPSVRLNGTSHTLNIVAVNYDVEDYTNLFYTCSYSADYRVTNLYTAMPTSNQMKLTPSGILFLTNFSAGAK